MLHTFSTLRPNCRCNGRRLYTDETIPPKHGDRRIGRDVTSGRNCYEYFDADFIVWIAYP